MHTPKTINYHTVINRISNKVEVLEEALYLQDLPPGERVIDSLTAHVAELVSLQAHLDRQTTSGQDVFDQQRLCRI